MTHDFQLVLQFPADCPLRSLDIEDDIAESLGNRQDLKSRPHYVDGNAIGATVEIFIHTNDPHAAFELIKPLLAREGLLTFATGAYRKLSENDFTVIWPANHQGNFSV